MEKTLKVLPDSVRNIFQTATIAIIGMVMVWVFSRSGWEPSTGILLLVAAQSSWVIFRDVRRRIRETTTDKGRVDASWTLTSMATAVMALLVVSLWAMKH